MLMRYARYDDARRYFYALLYAMPQRVVDDALMFLRHYAPCR